MSQDARETHCLVRGLRLRRLRGRAGALPGAAPSPSSALATAASGTHVVFTDAALQAASRSSAGCRRSHRRQAMRATRPCHGRRTEARALTPRIGPSLSQLFSTRLCGAAFLPSALHP